MTRRHASYLLAVTLLAAATVRAGSEVPTISPRLVAPLLFETLDARSTDCPPEIAEIGSRAPAECARVDRTWKQIKKATRSFLEEQAPGDAFSKAGWNRDGELRTRFASIGGQAIRLAFHEADGWVALAPTYLCLDPRKMKQLGVGVADGEEVSLPHVLQRNRPVWPEKPRQRGIVEGYAVVEAVIDAEGRVADVCVAHESPPGNDFGLAAAEALSGYRFEPAKRDGVAVPVSYITSISWTIRTR